MIEFFLHSTLYVTSGTKKKGLELTGSST